MITLEVILFVGLAIWIAGIVMRSDKLIRDIHRRLDELEERLKSK